MAVLALRRSHNHFMPADDERIVAFFNGHQEGETINWKDGLKQLFPDGRTSRVITGRFRYNPQYGTVTDFGREKRWRLRVSEKDLVTRCWVLTGLKQPPPAPAPEPDRALPTRVIWCCQCGDWACEGCGGDRLGDHPTRRGRISWIV